MASETKNVNYFSMDGIFAKDRDIDAIALFKVLIRGCYWSQCMLIGNLNTNNAYPNSDGHER